MAAKPVALVVGASRGIGRQIAIDLAANGYRVAVAGKTTSDAYGNSPFPPDPNSNESTINTVVREVKEAGGEALPVQVDVRNFENVEDMVGRVVEAYGRIDVLVYNSGAVWWSSVEKTPMKRFKLMQQVNPEGLYATIQACIPHWKAGGWKARVVVVSPPIYSRFFRGKASYAMGKVGMSVLTKGLAMDWAREGKTDMAITSIWPAAAIDSAATRNVSDDERAELRQPTIFSTAIRRILEKPTTQVSGELVLDEDFLREQCGFGDDDIAPFSLVEGAKPRRIMPVKFPPLEVEEQDDEGRRKDSTEDEGAIARSRMKDAKL